MLSESDSKALENIKVVALLVGLLLTAGSLTDRDRPTITTVYKGPKWLIDRIARFGN